MATPRDTAWARFLGIIAALALALTVAVPAYAQEGEIVASGSYNHYAGSEEDICLVPKELLGYGVWKTTGYGKVELIGEFGAFAGEIRWVRIDLAEAAEAEDHQISPEQRYRIAMARQ